MRDIDSVPQLKRELGAAIARELAEAQTIDAAATLDCDHWRISDLRAGRFERFSLATLVRYAARLGCTVNLSVERRRG